MIDDRFALYAGGFNKKSYPHTRFDLLDFNNSHLAGCVIEFEFNLDEFPVSYPIQFFNKTSVISIYASITSFLQVFYRDASNTGKYLDLQPLERGKTVKVIVCLDPTNGVKAFDGETIVFNANPVRENIDLTTLQVLHRSTSPSLAEQMQGWVRNIRVFRGVSLLSDADIYELYGGGKFVKNINLPATLKDKSIYELRCNQESGSHLVNTSFINKKPVPITVINPIKTIKGGGLWKQVEFEEEVPVEGDFEEVFGLGLYNGVAVNYVDPELDTNFPINSELTLLAENSTPERFQFSASTVNGSYIRGDVPLKNKMVWLLDFSSTKSGTFGANTVSLPAGQSNGLAFWTPNANQFAISIFHSGGTREDHLLSVGAIPLDGTFHDVRLMVYGVSGALELRVWVDGVLSLTSTSTRSVEDLNFQLGQYQNSNFRLNGVVTPLFSEGIRVANMFYVNKATIPTEAEVLALTASPKLESNIVKAELAGVSQVAGHVVYYPDFYNPANEYRFIVSLHGSGDGRDSGLGYNNPLTHTATEMIMGWLNRNGVEFIVLSPQFTNGTYTEAGVIAYLDHVFNASTGIFKDQRGTNRIVLEGYSKGANAIDSFIDSENAYNDIVEIYVPIAGNMQLSPALAADGVAAGQKMMIFSATDDPVSGDAASKNLYAAWHNAAIAATLEPDTVARITQFNELEEGEEHDILRDYVYNNIGTTKPQEEGTYLISATAYPYHNWLDTTWWDDLRVGLGLMSGDGWG